MTRFASPADYILCKELHRKFGTTYYYATLRFPAEIRERVHAIYAFVRVPDEWVDNPGTMSLGDRSRKLSYWRTQLQGGFSGVPPDHFAMRAFVDVAAQCRIPIEEALCFIDAMEMDLTKNRYRSYDELQNYMRGSASAVGVLMCHAMETACDPATLSSAMKLGEAMQLTNFLRDMGEDADRGRIYVPTAELEQFSVSEGDILRKRYSPEFRELMRFQIDRARQLYAEADPGITCLPCSIQKPVLLARVLYAQILDCIERQDYDVFRRRARTSKTQKLGRALQVAVAPQQLLGRSRNVGA